MYACRLQETCIGFWIVRQIQPSLLQGGLIFPALKYADCCHSFDLDTGQLGSRMGQQTLSRVAPMLDAGPQAVQQRKTGASIDGSVHVRATGSHNHIVSSDGGRDIKGMSSCL